MANVPLPTPTDSPVPSTDIRDAVYAGAMLDKVVTSTDLKYTDRLGGEHYTVDGMKAEGDRVVEETRQNLIPLSRQYMTLAAAQADIANIPDGSATYYRSPDDSALAIEVINNAGTLEPTGRKMPALASVLATIDNLTNLLTAIQGSTVAISDIQDSVNSAITEIIDNSFISVEDTNRILINLLTGLQGAETAVAELEQDKISESRFNDHELFVLFWLQTFGTQFAELEGLSTDTIATKQELAELESKITGVALEPVVGGVYVVGKPRGIVRIDLSSSQDIPSAKSDGDVPGYISLKIDGQSFGAHCNFSVQGASSSVYAKKNLSFDLFSDDTREEEVKLAIGDVLPHETWVYKANWIDTTHVRNTMSYSLWEQVVQSRKTWPKREVESVFVGKFGEDGTFNGANGHPIGYPCVMYFNGEFYGIGDIMTGKKRSNYNLAKNKPLEIQLDIGGWLTFGAFSEHITDMNYVEFKAPKSPTSATYSAITDWDTFCNLPQADFISQLGTRLDKTNIVDYFLFTTFGNFTDCGAVNTIKNTQLISYNGIKWYFMPYDLDTCYGLQWDGKSINYPANNPIRLNGDFWIKVRAAYNSDINARWAELRNNGIFTVSNIYTLIMDLQSKYSRDLFSAEFEKWPEVPSLSITGVDQILTWVNDRLAFLDTQFSYQA
ncbi:CotH kinase family protein [Klebsiella pneumoniae]|uniref:CotH kinase family protein n=1 Tax=Klebsiella pneumoniae TaxID=573 RepID=UPI0038B43B27